MPTAYVLLNSDLGTDVSIIAEIKQILSAKGNTEINLVIIKKNQKAYYSLENKRKFDLNHFNSLKTKEYVIKINV